MRRPRAVFDAGVLLSALLRPAGPPGALLRMLVQGRAFELVVSDSIMEELHFMLADGEVRRHLESTPEALERWSAALGLLATHVRDREEAGEQLELKEPGVGADPGDDKYLTAALLSGADMIISTDPHLLDMQDRPAIEVVTPKMFLEVLELAREAKAGT